MKSYIEYKCTICHPPERIFKKKRTPEEWEKIIHRMGERNRNFITSDDEKKILNYFLTEKSFLEQEDKTQTKKGDSDAEEALRPEVAGRNESPNKRQGR